MHRKILIADDNKINRMLLRNILSKDYDIIEACDGNETLSILHHSYKYISAVVLDIMMPGADGFEVLESIRGNAMLAPIPVIVATGAVDEATEEKAIALGANDFIKKPYNPAMILHSLRNAINLRETASIVNALQRDKLTGAYNRETFFDKVEALIREKEPGYYVLSSLDIDNFKLINDQYGAAQGDRILKSVSAVIAEDMIVAKGLFGRISGDNFATLYPAYLLHRGRPFLDKMRETASNDSATQTRLNFSIGRYIIVDTSLPAATLYDRAYLAKQSIKGRYDEHIAYFDETMLEQLVIEHELTNDIENAIKNRQFEVWYQPQYNHSTGALVGAEALVRWRHHAKGLVAPSQFIPLFEQNGFIYELDKYVWEEVCRNLRKWIDEGRQPLPVSVNISRHDLFRTDLIDTITSLVEKYGLTPNHLRLEITESAFSKSAEKIVDVIKQMIERGFTVEIDDFGSGYSSLNVLKDVPAQVIKLDMRFLSGKGDNQRGGNIIGSIVRMINWLGMSVIAEGVEEIAEADFLKSIGCEYIQGYLYAKPMPMPEYESHFTNAEKENNLNNMESVETLDNNAFWDPKSMDTLIFNSYVGSACIFEYTNGKLDLLRINDKFVQELGYGISRTDVFKEKAMENIDKENYDVIIANILNAIETNRESTCEAIAMKLYGAKKPLYIQSTVRVIARSGNRYLLYGTIRNTTIRHEAENMRKELLDNLPYGASLCEFDGKEISIVHINKRCRELLAMQPSSPVSEFTTELLHPDDREPLFEEILHAIKLDRDIQIDIRVADANGEYRLFRITGRIVPKADGKYTIYSLYTPVSGGDIVYREAFSTVLSAIMESFDDVFFIKDRRFRYLCASDRFIKSMGCDTESDIIGKTDHDLLDKESADKYAEEDRKLIQGDEVVIGIDEKETAPDGTICYLRTSKRPVRDRNGNIIGVYGVVRDVTEYHDTIEKFRLLTDSIKGGLASYVFTKDKITLTYCNITLSTVFGYSEDEYKRLAAADPLFMVHREDLPLIYESLNNLRDTGKPIVCDFRVYTKSNEQKWVNLRGTLAERDADGAVLNAVFFDVTEQYDTNEKLRLSEEVYRIARQHIGNPICRYYISDKSAVMPRDIAKAYGIPERMENVPEGQIEEGVVSPETADSYRALYNEIRSGSKSGNAVFMQKIGESWRWLRAKYSTLFSATGEPVSAVVSFVDVTEQREKEAVYTKWQQSIKAKTPDSYTLYRCNLSKGTWSGVSEGELLRVTFSSNDIGFDGCTAEYTERYVFEDDRERYSEFLDSDILLANYYRGKRFNTIDYREKPSAGATRWLRLTVELIEYPDSTDIEAFLMYEDISDIKRAELEMLELAERDSLTGILNRKAFVGRFNKVLEEKQKGICALIMLDIDGFKLVNDSFGHTVGDSTLIDIASTLNSTVQKSDIVGRLGGDEFLVCLRDVASRAAIGIRAKQICRALKKSLSIEVQISASLGIAVYPNDGTSFDELYLKADTALYHIKATGKNNYAFFNDRMVGEELKQDGQVEIKPISSVSDEKLKRRMLIVEDDEINREMLMNQFKDDYFIDTAADGTTALNRIRRYGISISVILLDLMLPGISGFEILEKIRENKELDSVPVVIVSGIDERQAALRTIKCGASDFVTKPIDPDLLRIRVESAVAKAENERLSTQNRVLAMLGNESAKYRTVFENENMVMLEYDTESRQFTFDSSLPLYLSGKYDGRTLWKILDEDGVADADTVVQMRKLVAKATDDDSYTLHTENVILKAPSGEPHYFCFKAVRRTDEYQNGEKIILTLSDKGQAEKE